jgi:hypothetical protein
MTKVKRQLLMAFLSFEAVWWAAALAALSGYSAVHRASSWRGFFSELYSSRRFSGWLYGSFIAGGAAAILNLLPLVTTECRDKTRPASRGLIWSCVLITLVMSLVAAMLSYVQLIDEH